MADKVRGPFSRIHDSWIDAWARAGLGRTQLLVMLKLCENIEFDKNGNAVTWYPRDVMAENLGLTDSAVKLAITRLKKLGFLAVRKPGSRGHVTTYVVMPHMRWPVKRGIAGDTQSDKKGYHDTPHRGIADDTPLRHIDGGGSPADAGDRPTVRNTLAEIIGARERGEEPEWLR